MFYIMFNILLAVVCVEAITNILTKSELFLPIRKFLFDRQFSLFCRWLHSLLDCGYCTSVWVGWFIAIMYLIGLLDNVFFWGLALHRMSNLLHHIIDRVWGKENI